MNTRGSVTAVRPGTLLGMIPVGKACVRAQVERVGILQSDANSTKFSCLVRSTALEWAEGSDPPKMGDTYVFTEKNWPTETLNLPKVGKYVWLAMSCLAGGLWSPTAARPFMQGHFTADE